MGVTPVDFVKMLKQRDQNDMILHYIVDKNFNTRNINGRNDIGDTLGTYIYFFIKYQINNCLYSVVTCVLYACYFQVWDD